MEQLKQLSNPDRLEVIEAATRLVRTDLSSKEEEPRDKRCMRLQQAAMEAKALYEPGGELTEWRALDGEDFHDYVEK